jgi:hypothetical protein
MRWVSADYQMPDRLARFVLSRQRLVEHGISHAAIGDLANLGPDSLDAAFRAMLIEARPELVGAVILYIGFTPSELSWEIVVSHASLPPKPWASEAKREPLWPERDEQEAEAA